MKIIKIRFRNLNSLAGEWEIDLSDVAYRKEGIFVIAGATGAGKSTILDALCLALYGRTPRLKTISDNDNEIMTRQTAECFAEVVFETTKNGKKCRYRSYWGQHRARKNAEGPLQSPRREIADVDSGKILESKIMEVNRLIEKETGMDYERFTRSMLLAQGDFTTFLKATPAERSPILEQITGTRIYSDISIAVHERFSAEKQRLKDYQTQVDGIRLFSEEELTALKQELSNRQTAVANNKSELEKLTVMIAWREKIQTLEHQSGEAERSHQEYEDKIQAFKPEQTRLNRANLGLPLTAEYATLKIVRTLQNTEMDELNKKRWERPVKEKEVSVARQRETDARMTLESAKTEQERLRPVLTAVRRLDTQIQEKNGRIEALHGEIKRFASLLQDAGREKSKMNGELEKNREELTKIENWLFENQTDASLGEMLPAIKKSIDRLKEAADRLKELTEDQQRANKENDENTERYKNENAAFEKSQINLKTLRDRVSQQEGLLKDLLSGKTLAQWRDNLGKEKEKRNTLEQMVEAMNRIYEAERRFEELSAREKELLEAMEKNRTEIDDASDRKKDAEQKEHLLEQNLLLLNRIRDLEQERLKLTDGKPCPLCGSIDHPYASGNIPKPEEGEAELVQVRKKTQDISETLNRLQRAESSYETEMKGVKAEHAEKGKGMQRDNAFYEALCRKIGVEPLPPAPRTIDARRSLLLETLHTISHTEQQMTKIEEENGKWEYLRSDVSELEKENHEAERALAETKQKKTLSEQYATQSSENLKKVKKSVEAAEAELLREIRPFGIDRIVPAELDNILTVLNARKEKWGQKKAAKEKAGREIFDAEQKILSCAKGIEEKIEEINRKNNDWRTLKEELDRLTEDRKTLFQEKDPDAEEKRICDDVVVCENEVNRVRETSEKIMQSFESLKNRIEMLEESVRQRTVELSQKEARMAERIRRQGFIDETDFVSACLEESLRKNLEQESGSLKQQEDYYARECQKLSASLNAERNRNMTEKTLPQLSQEKEQLTVRNDAEKERIGAVRNALEDYQKALTEKEGQLRLIRKQKIELLRWEELHELIGSADGKRYRNFAQGVTFETMVAHANRQLQKMTDRYLLTCNPDNPLELNIIDLYQAGEVRSAKNLSGGESFLVSLSLALGLSRMSSRNVRVDSLFLDEGFGTLDDEALDQALTTLASLRQEDKLIGVISHVQTLKDRIPIQIEVVPLGGGISMIKGPGCRRLEEWQDIKQ